MSDNNTPSTVEQSNIHPVQITDELKTCFINYAMSVIVDRALPNVYDGLKPVQRRSIYGMYEQKIFYGTKTVKSAKVVGDVMGRFHPHGDSAIYETIVRMAQPFSLRYPLVHGNGNFGNIDGDGAAAMRYTEISMSKICAEMVADIEKETVDTVLNYDGSETMPVVLPNKFPNLLVNGATGIAVGMATNIPTHNLTETINATIATIQNPEITISELMQYIPAPDFPTGGIIYGQEGIRRGYETGNGKVIIRAKTHVEGEEGEKQSIVIDEIPYCVRKQRLVERINECMREKLVEGITSVEDYSGKDHDVRIVIGIRKDQVPEIVLNKLFKLTDLQSSFPMNMLALVDNRPEVLNLKQMLELFIKHRKEIVIRRTVHDLAKARDRAHKLESYAVALANIDEIIELIKTSENKTVAREKLMSKGWDYGDLNSIIERTEDGKELTKPSYISDKFGCVDGLYYLSDIQADAILEMQLHRLTNLESTKIYDEYNALKEEIKEYLSILVSDEKLKSIIISELEVIRENYGDARRSVIELNTSEISKKDLIEAEAAVITLSHEGYIKYQPLDEYTTQARGGKGKRATKMKDEDFIDSMYVVNTHDTVLCFTNLGRVFSMNVYDLPLASSNSKGRPIVNMLRLNEGEKVKVILPIDNFDGERFLLFATSSGLVKKTKLNAYKNINVGGLIAIKLKEGDEIVNVAITSGKDNVVLFSSDGRACMFNEYYPGLVTDEGVDIADEDVVDEVDDDANDEGLTDDAIFSPSYKGGIRPSGRATSGVRGIKLAKSHKLVSMIVVDPNVDKFLMVCENGYGKRTLVADFPRRSRNCKGVIAIKTSERNGRLVGAIQVADSDQTILITSAGILIRVNIAPIACSGRNTQGVRIIKMEEGSSLVAIQRVLEDDRDDVTEQVVEADTTNTEGVAVQVTENQQADTPSEG